MTLERTCGNCPHLVAQGCERNAFASCKKTGTVVPHGWQGGVAVFTFWRIADDCPRDDVLKSKAPAKREHWVTKKLNEVTTL